ncbi:MAG: rod shape-determining protein MreC [Proteobacteria bacterium]|nr:MAG: rod shape-determining protein MreC [Pseudomonadota bacterium]
MVTLSSDSRPIIARGPSLGARFFLLALVSIVVMVLDTRSGHLEAVRLWLGTAMSPLYVVVQAPFDFWGWLTGSFADRARLRAENEQLREELRTARVKLLEFEALVLENQRLRAIREASAGIGERTLIAEIIRVDLDPFRHRVRIDKGAREGVFKGQPVLDAHGIVGQVTRVDHYSAEVILISDSEHAIPVQVNRNGIRTIAVGTGEADKLNLPFLTADADVAPGDLLVSSGLDDVFPAGYPVARVFEVKRDPAATFAAVEAVPLAQLDRSREVLLLWVAKEPEPADGTEEPHGAPGDASEGTSRDDAPATPRPPANTPVGAAGAAPADTPPGSAGARAADAPDPSPPAAAPESQDTAQRGASGAG